MEKEYLQSKQLLCLGNVSNQGTEANHKKDTMVTLRATSNGGGSEIGTGNKFKQVLVHCLTVFFLRKKKLCNTILESNVASTIKYLGPDFGLTKKDLNNLEVTPILKHIAFFQSQNLNVILENDRFIETELIEKGRKRFCGSVEKKKRDKKQKNDNVEEN